MPRQPVKSARSVSCRSFIRQAAAGVGAVATGSAAVDADQRHGQRIASDTTATGGSAIPPPPGIRAPDELIAGSKAPAVEIQFPRTGAQVFARACRVGRRRRACLLPRQLRRHSRDCRHRHPDLLGTTRGHDDACSRCVHSSVGRAGGRVGNRTRDAANHVGEPRPFANVARAPLLVVASNMALFQEGTEAGIQLAYQQPTTDGMKKYGKRLVTPSRVHEYTAYAFRQLRGRRGVPRPGPPRLSDLSRRRALRLGAGPQSAHQGSPVVCITGAGAFGGKNEFWLRDSHPPGMLGKIEPGCMSYYH